MRFRLNKFALATDIEKAFLHVGLDEQDRDVTRFLWLTNPDDPNSPLCTYRFKAVLFGATCSPFILNATLLKHMDENDAPVTQLLKQDLYVDNILSSLPTENEALNYFRESRQLMSKASFNLRLWTSNSVALRDLATSEGVLDTDALTKILGMRWNVQTDLLSYPSRNLSYVQKSIITKRDILQQTSRVYDPLGFLSPVSVRAKILMQLLWEQKFGWHEPLPTKIRSSWIDLADDLDKAASLEIPRHYFLDTANVQRFISNCRSAKSRRQPGSLTTTELQLAGKTWILDCQNKSYQAEITSMQSDCPSHLQLVRQLRLFIDKDGAIRCGGRIHNSPVTEEAKFPYLLPTHHELTTLIVMDAQVNQLHAGLNSTVTLICQTFWIPSIRQCVKGILRRCVTCRKVIGRPYSAPDPPPLPKSRLQESPPFSVTGVDFTGALYVTTTDGSESKAYICLFTCASTRAVHLEVVPDLREDSFLRAFRRFVSLGL